MSTRKTLRTDEQVFREVEARFHAAWKTWDDVYKLYLNKGVDGEYVKHIMGMVCATSKEFITLRDERWCIEAERYQLLNKAKAVKIEEDFDVAAYIELLKKRDKEDYETNKSRVFNQNRKR